MDLDGTTDGDIEPTDRTVVVWTESRVSLSFLKHE